MTKWDDIVLQWLHSHNTPLGLRIIGTFTYMGTAPFTSLVGVGIGVLLARKRKWALFVGWVAALVGGPVIENILKWFIRRPRPEFAAPFLHRFSYSFPSGHAMNSTIVYGMLAYILVTVWPRGEAAKSGIIICSVLLVLGIGFSRLYLGVHYFSDVIGGFAAGFFWLSLCIALTNLLEKRGFRN